MLSKKLMRVALVVSGLLLIPITLQLTIGTGIDGQGWNWKPGDFVFAWGLWFLAGSTYQLLAYKTSDPNRKLLYGIIVFVILAIIWVGAATGFEGIIDRFQAIR